MALLLVPAGLFLAGLVWWSVSTRPQVWADAIGNWLNPIIFKIPIIGPALEKLIVNGASWLANRLGKAFLDVSGKVINWFGALAHYVQMVSNLSLTWPIKLVEALRWLLGTEIPRLVHALPSSVTRLVHDALKIVGALERQASSLVAHLPGTVGKLAKAVLIGALAPFLLPLHWLQKEWRLIAKAAAHAGGIAVPWIWVPRLRRDVINLRKELTKVRGLLGVTGFAIVMARVLRVTPKCLKDGNIGKAARGLCGIPSDLFGLLIGGLLVLEGGFSVRALAEGLLDVEDELIAAMSVLITELDDLT